MADKGRKGREGCSGRKRGGSVGDAGEGSTSVECGLCGSWTVMEGLKGNEPEEFMCGFCSQKRIKELENQIKALLGKMEQKPEKEEREHTEPTWTEIVKKNVKQTIKQEVRKVNQEIKKENNIIVKGVSEGEGDQEKIKTLFQCLEIDPDQVGGTQRIGEKKEKNRPIRITFKSRNPVYVALNNKKKLKSNKELNSIFVEPDMTKEEQEQNWKLRKELKERREKGEYCYIKNNQIVSKGPFLPKKEREKQHQT